MARQLLWFGFLLRVVIAFWNGFYGPSFGADGDAPGFHEIAAEYAAAGLQTDRYVFGLLYSYALGVIYYFTFSSLFWGGLLSAFAWLASAHLLIRTMRLVSFTRHQQRMVILIYALLPSSIMWTGVTLREAYQMLFVNLAVYSSLRIYMTKSVRHWLWLVAAGVAGGLLQPGLMAFGVLLLAGTALSLLMRRRHGIPIGKLLWVAPLALGIVAYGYSTFADFISTRFEEGLIRAIEGYQQGGLSIEARTHYKDSVSIDGWSGLLVFVPVSLFQYLFEPMPWRISSVIDILPLIENLLRAFLIWRAWWALRRLPTAARRPVLLVFLAYLSLETLFALGTVNWGTSARHHLPGMGLLLVSAFALPRRRRRLATVPPPAAQGVPAAA
jgi:hypothetical protein